MLVLIALLILLVLMIPPKREMFGYTDPVGTVVMDDPAFDTTEYVEALTYTSIDHDLMEKCVLATNKYVSEKTGLCTYIIETTSIRKYSHAKDPKKGDMYRCMFMLMRQHGFSFGFAVTVDILVYPNGTVKVVGAQTQPMNIVPPSNRTPFESEVIEGHEFPAFSLFEQSELNLIKIVPPSK